jgi:hypothetical protein
MAIMQPKDIVKIPINFKMGVELLLKKKLSISTDIKIREIRRKKTNRYLESFPLY